MSFKFFTELYECGTNIAKAIAEANNISSLQVTIWIAQLSGGVK